MKYNMINEIEFDMKDEYKELFTAILSKVSTLLKVDMRSVCSIILVKSTQIHAINKEYRNIERPTDVLSFASMEGDVLIREQDDEIELGDIFINVDCIDTQASEYGHSYSRELCFLFTHGVLHLLGYDHMEKDEEEIMKSLQREVLDEIIPR